MFSMRLSWSILTPFVCNRYPGVASGFEDSKNREPKKNPKAKKSHEQRQRVFWTIRGGYRSLPFKTRVLRQIAPESSAKSLSQKFFGVPFLSLKEAWFRRWRKQRKEVRWTVGHLWSHGGPMILNVFFPYVQTCLMCSKWVSTAGFVTMPSALVYVTMNDDYCHVTLPELGYYCHLAEESDIKTASTKAQNFRVCEHLRLQTLFVDSRL